ncbi:hemolysin D [Acetobacter orientalis]|uniref:Hemolysin D n=1 Tax=Acetobacter orientalis TaxID=146474 RepID=A0A2Z5ZI79_9PROT|nr:hemolysin D [Acetobacter orientalis]
MWCHSGESCFGKITHIVPAGLLPGRKMLRSTQQKTSVHERCHD